MKKLNSATPIDPSTLRAIIDKCISVRRGEATWKEAAAFAQANDVDISPDVLRQNFGLLGKALESGMRVVPPDATPASEEVLEDETETIPACIDTKADGTSARDYYVERDRLMKLFENGDLSEKKVREFFGIPDSLLITGMKYQMWHGAVKGGGKQILYNIRVNLKPQTAEDLRPEDFAKFFERNGDSFPALPPVPKFAPIPDGATYLEVDLADPHFGLLAHAPETGENYDLKIARTRTLLYVKDVVKRYSGRKFACINFVTLGDIVHVDNGDMTTTHGTKQDAEGRVPKMLDVAVSTLVEAIRALEELESPIRYTYVPGNHDTNLGYAVAMTVKAWLRDDPNVTFDITPSLFKTATYGKTIVGFNHGEAKDARAHTDLINQHRRDFGLADYAEIHMGHLHEEAARDVIGGIMLYRVPAICTSSYWEKSKGYPAVNRGGMTFEYDPVAGKIGIGYHTISGIMARMDANN